MRLKHTLTDELRETTGLQPFPQGLEKGTPASSPDLPTLSVPYTLTLSELLVPPGVPGAPGLWICPAPPTGVDVQEMATP